MKFMYAVTAACALAATMVSAGSVQLTGEVFNDAITEKNVFVKFQAPW
jgi:hypothetical protein